LWSQEGEGLKNSAGLLIEQGRYEEIDIALIEGARTYLPGSEVPNYTLMAPNDLPVYANSITVEDATFLSDLLRDRLGHFDWAACTRYQPY